MMFRKKEIEPVPPLANEEAAKGPARPEPSRRRLDLPLGSGAPAQAGPPPRVYGQAAPRPEPGGVPAREGEAADKRLIVGRGIRLSGEITACDRLVVEGDVRVTLNETRALEIAPTGRFIGGCEVEEAEVAGAFEGDLTVHGRLLVRATGAVTGTIRYGELEIERGGRLAGNVAVVGVEAPAAATPGGAASGAKAPAPPPAGGDRAIDRAASG